MVCPTPHCQARKLPAEANAKPLGVISRKSAASRVARFTSLKTTLAPEARSPSRDGKSNAAGGSRNDTSTIVNMHRSAGNAQFPQVRAGGRVTRVVSEHRRLRLLPP